MKIPKPYRPSTRHTQLYPGVLFVYSMKCRQSSSYKNFTKNVNFWLLFDPWDKSEKSKTLLRICETCPINLAMIKNVDGVQVTRNSSDERTDRGNNNIPEL